MGRRSGESASVTLFSFLDILTFCIGSLILILISITLISSENKVKDVIIKVKAEEEADLEKTPVYMEVQQEQVVILPQGQVTPFGKLDKKESNFMKFVGSLNRHKQYVLFAIRPKGIMTFKKARSITEKMGIDIGFEPIEEEWNIVVK